jgi:hypothetical protein
MVGGATGPGLAGPTFSYMSFPHKVSHKGFNEALSIQEYISCHLMFPLWF